MADRFPLILNTNANQIQEIASGDSLDLTGTNIANAGIITAGNVVIGAATTDLLVNGNARVTGILTVGTGSLTLDGPNNLVNVGTALTLGHTQGLQFHTQNLHSAGFEVNQINVSGVTTIGGKLDTNGVIEAIAGENKIPFLYADLASLPSASTYHGMFAHVHATGKGYYAHGGAWYELVNKDTNGNVALNKDLDVDGHTNLDNISVVGVSTFTGNASFSGNVSIGGTLTYEDVTNIDSVGIITARQGVRLGVDGTSSQNYISVGDGDDLKIWHQSSNNHSYISETGSGSLIVLADDFYVQDTSTNTMISAKEGAEVNLHYNGGSPKLSTTNTGIDVTGVINTTVSGADNMLKIQTSTSGNPILQFNAAGSGGHDIFYNRSTNELVFKSAGGSDRLVIAANGDLRPATDSQYNIGSNTIRFANIYADTLYGDGSNITGITQTTINNNANNRLITGSGTANTLEGESNLTYDGTSLTIGAADDIRLTTGDWTGNSAAKIQHHNNYLYITTGTSGLYIRDENTNNWWVFDTNGHFKPTTDSAIDIGATGTRVRNLYVDDITVTGTVATAGASMSNGAGAVTVSSNGDIRLGDGSWTGEHGGKIQYHGKHMYMQVGDTDNTAGWIFRDSGGNSTLHLMANGTTTGKNLSFGQDVLFNSGPGACTIKAHSDIRLENGNWTGNTYGKIQHHANSFYICGGSNGNYAIILRDNNADRIYMTTGGTFYPTTNNYSDLGTSVNRWRNIYTNDLNLSNKDGANDVDGTWGNYTIQEGENDLFLINNRSGKKYKFNLTEVS